MNNIQILTIAIALGTSFLAVLTGVLLNNSRLNEVKELLRAEIRAAHAEMRAEFAEVRGECGPPRCGPNSPRCGASSRNYGRRCGHSTPICWANLPNWIRGSHASRTSGGSCSDHSRGVGNLQAARPRAEGPV